MHYNYSDANIRKRHKLSVEGAQRKESCSLWWLPGERINSSEDWNLPEGMVCLFSSSL